MKYLSFSVLVFIAGIIILPGCSKSNYESGNNRIVKLHTCSQPILDSYICFDSLVTDSRCPKGVECIWQGTAVIKVSFHERDNTHIFRMSLDEFPFLGYPHDTTINGYQIVFKDLSPYPDANKPAPIGTPVEATFIISK